MKIAGVKFSGKDLIIGGAVVLLIWGNLGKLMGWDKDGSRTKTIIKTEVRTDTVTKIIENIIIKQPIVTHNTREIKIPYIPILDTIGGSTGQISDSMTIQLPVNRYEDTIEVDGATLSYYHDIAGYLEKSSYRISYPKETITIKETVKEIQVKNRIYDVFATASYGFQSRQPRIGVDLVAKKWKIGYSFGREPILKNGINLRNSHEISLGVRLFGY